MLKNRAYKLFDSQEKMGYWCCELTQDVKSQAKQNKVHMKLYKLKVQIHFNCSYC